MAPKDKDKKGIVLRNDLIYEMVETDPDPTSPSFRIRILPFK
jgi:hypothetical protein